MVQGKNNELQPLVNRRKGYQVPVQTAYQQKVAKIEAGYSSPSPYSQEQEFVQGTPAFGDKIRSSQDDEMNNEYSHDIAMKIKKTSPKDTISKICKGPQQQAMSGVTVSAFEPFPPTQNF